MPQANLDVVFEMFYNKIKLIISKIQCIFRVWPDMRTE